MYPERCAWHTAGGMQPPDIRASAAGPGVPAPVAGDGRGWQQLGQVVWSCIHLQRQAIYGASAGADPPHAHLPAYDQRKLLPLLLSHAGHAPGSPSYSWMVILLNEQSCSMQHDSACSPCTPPPACNINNNMASLDLQAEQHASLGRQVGFLSCRG